MKKVLIVVIYFAFLNLGNSQTPWETNIIDKTNSLAKEIDSLRIIINNQETYRLFRNQSDTIATTELLKTILEFYEIDDLKIDRFVWSMRNHFTVSQEKMVIRTLNENLSIEKSGFLRLVGFYKLKKFKPLLEEIVLLKYGDSDLIQLTNRGNTRISEDMKEYLIHISTISNLGGLKEEDKILDVVMNRYNKITTSNKSDSKALGRFANDVLYSTLPYIHSANCIQKTSSIYFEDKTIVYYHDMEDSMAGFYFSNFLLEKFIGVPKRFHEMTREEFERSIIFTTARNAKCFNLRNR